MKPILMMGGEAFSPFRLDALRAALAAADPTLADAKIDARWVYAIEPEGKGPGEKDCRSCKGSVFHKWPPF